MPLPSSSKADPDRIELLERELRLCRQRAAARPPGTLLLLQRQPSGSAIAYASVNGDSDHLPRALGKRKRTWPPHPSWVGPGVELHLLCTRFTGAIEQYLANHPPRNLEQTMAGRRMPTGYGADGVEDDGSDEEGESSAAGVSGDESEVGSDFDDTAQRRPIDAVHLSGASHPAKEPVASPSTASSSHHQLSLQPSRSASFWTAPDGKDVGSVSTTLNAPSGGTVDEEEARDGLARAVDEGADDTGGDSVNMASKGRLSARDGVPTGADSAQEQLVTSTSNAETAQASAYMGTGIVGGATGHGENISIRKSGQIFARRRSLSPGRREAHSDATHAREAIPGAQSQPAADTSASSASLRPFTSPSIPRARTPLSPPRRTAGVSTATHRADSPSYSSFVALLTGSALSPHTPKGGTQARRNVEIGRQAEQAGSTDTSNGATEETGQEVGTDMNLGAVADRVTATDEGALLPWAR